MLRLSLFGYYQQLKNAPESKLIVENIRFLYIFLLNSKSAFKALNEFIAIALSYERFLRFNIYNYYFV